MSEIRVNKIVNEAGSGSVEFSEGATLPSGKNLSGSGTITMNVTGNVSGNAGGLTGTPNIVVGSVTGTTGAFSGNVSVGGTLTYEDVTNIDSVGVVTARSGVNLNGLLREEIKITAGKLSDNLNINLDNGMVHHFTTQETATAIPNIMSSVGINTQMGTGDAIAVTIITTAAAGGYSASITIDGAANDVKWSGGADPSAGGASGNDVYALQIIKTGSAAYTVLGALNNFA